MKKLILLLMIVANGIIAQTDTSLIISEIMFNPNGSNTEYVELYNLSDTESIDLNGYKFKYYTSNADVIISAGFGTILSPKSFAIVLEGDYDFTSGIYNSLIPANALILKISDNAFGTSGMANTTDRPLALSSPNNDTLEIKIYTANNGTGISDEKVLMSKDTTASNWGNSLINNGTPGYRNSVTPLENDIAVTIFNLQSNQIVVGNSFLMNATVKNLGSSTANNISVKFFFDANNNNLPEPDEMVNQQEISSLISGDTIRLVNQFVTTFAGAYRFFVSAEYIADENLVNNALSVIGNALTPSALYNDIVINEIMYAPSTGEPEWVELFNKSTSTINLKNWKIKDNTTTQANISNTDLFLEPDSFLVISNNSSISNFYNVSSKLVVISFPALNNTDDAVVIKDSNGFVIDSVYYFSSWGGSSGRSLERIYVDSNSLPQSNWKISAGIFKGTPGRKNSVSPKNFDLSISNISSDKKYVTENETANLLVWVKNLGEQNSTEYKVQLFADLNQDSIATISELISEVSGNNLLSKDSTNFSLAVSQFTIGLNRFIVKVVFTLDEDTLNNSGYASLQKVVLNEVRNDLVINEIMYAPSIGEPEWIELFNRSSKSINLKNYKIADSNDTLTVNVNSIVINPSEYIVVTRDSSILQYYNVGSKIIKATFPTLNNDFDKVVILDSLNRTIDSLRYQSNWGGASGGKSLERVSIDVSSTDSSNWKTNNSTAKATPGKINSVTRKQYDLQLSHIVSEPSFPISGDSVLLYARVKNIGKVNASFTIQLFDDNDFDSSSTTKIYESSIYNLGINDSIFTKIDYPILNLQSKQQFIVNVYSQEDEDLTNNSVVYTLTTGYPRNSIVINEIMYVPSGGEPEWIELYNPGPNNIILKDWAVSDILTTPVKVFIRDSVIINSGEFLVITRDSTIFNFHRTIPSKMVRVSIPNLNNDVDGIILYDERGAVMDSLLYSSTWGGTSGFSLERVSSSGSSIIQSNWGTSKDIEQSTPGRINSISQKDIDLTFSDVQFTPQYPKLGDEVNISVTVKNLGSQTSSPFSLVYKTQSDSLNAEVFVLDSLVVLGINSFDSSQIVARRTIPSLQTKTKVIIEIFSFDDSDPFNNIIQRFVEPGFAPKTILISELMYDPKNIEPEWIEIVNVSSDTVNLKNWSVSDLLTTPTKVFITSSDYIMFPQQRVVLARDTTLNSFYPGTSIQQIKTLFGTLSSTSDGVLIYDFRNAIIDSVMYKSSWGGRNGFSLERINLSGISNDSTNWATSLYRATPGKINSVEYAPSYSRNQIIINEIMYESDIDNSEFIEFFNSSNDSVNIGGWRIEDEKRNFYKLSDTSFIIPPGELFVLLADSISLQKYSNLVTHQYKTVLSVSNLGLVNSGELILLKDLRGNIIDSVFYSDSWHNKQITTTRNKSLERINPNIASHLSSNWSTSVHSNGATPGITNSIFADNTQKSKIISIEPNPFSPDNDGYEDFTIINYNLTQSIAQVRIKVFDNKGRLVRNLANNLPSGNKGSIIFDGRDDGGNPLRIGIYIVLLEAVGIDNSVVETLKTAIVVARKL